MRFDVIRATPPAPSHPYAKAGKSLLAEEEMAVDASPSIGTNLTLATRMKSFK